VRVLHFDRRAPVASPRSATLIFVQFWIASPDTSLDRSKTNSFKIGLKGVYLMFFEHVDAAKLLTNSAQFFSSDATTAGCLGTDVVRRAKPEYDPIADHINV
jgi:hypothetical protein